MAKHFGDRVPVIVDCLTDNNNRTASEIKQLFKTAHLGTPGSVAWMFDHVGLIEAHHADTKLDIETSALEADADNVETITRRVNGGLNGFDDRKAYLARAKWFFAI